jgi:hypothetical protein
VRAVLGELVIADPDLATVLAAIAVGVCPRGFVR